MPIGGYGEFDGVLLEAFKRPRIQGTFNGERIRAWDVVWGSGRADLAIENSYVFVSNATLTQGRLGDSRRRAVLARVPAPGRRRRDRRARPSHAAGRSPTCATRSARRLSGRRHGVGRVPALRQVPDARSASAGCNIEKGAAYGETFDTATSSLRFEGTGVRLDNIDIKKSTGGVTGAAWVGWDGNYSFNADGARIPVESLVSVAFPRAPLSGRLQFNATGAGTFDEPRYDVKLGSRRSVRRRRRHRAAVGHG